MLVLKRLTIFICFIIIFFLLTKRTFSDLKINEIYPAPPSGQEEWVELYNDEKEKINLSDFFLFDKAGNNIKLINENESSNFFIATSSRLLNNDGDVVYLYKCPESQLVDWVAYTKDINNDAISYGRFPDGSASWGICLPTKNASNSGCIITPTPTIDPTITPFIFICPTSTPTPTPTQTPIPTLAPTSSPTSLPTLTPIPVFLSYDNIYLSEVMVNPGSGEKEWVEIYNDNDFLVELKNWFIDDLENAGSTAKTFNITIDKKSYGVIELPSAIFNNNGDQVRLLDFNKTERDSFEYSSSQIGKSYGRISFASDEWCQQEPSRGEKNNACLTNPTKVNSSLTTSFISQATNSPLIPSSKNKDNLFLTKKIYKSYQPKLQVYTPEKKLVTGEVLGEKTEESIKSDDILFLPIFQSLSMSFLFLRKILKSIKIEN